MNDFSQRHRPNGVAAVLPDRERRANNKPLQLVVTRSFSLPILASLGALLGDERVDDASIARMHRIELPARASIPSQYSDAELSLVLELIRHVRHDNAAVVLTPDLLLPWDVPRGLVESYRAALRPPPQATASSKLPKSRTFRLRSPHMLHMSEGWDGAFGDGPLSEAYEHLSTAVMSRITISLREGPAPAAYSDHEAYVVRSFIAMVEHDGKPPTPEELLPYDVAQGIADSFKATVTRAVSGLDRMRA